MSPEATNDQRFLAQRTATWQTGSRATAHHLLDLASDELQQPTAPHIIAATINALEQGATHYTDRKGIPALRAAVTTYFGEQDDLHYNPTGEVLVCGGGHEALFVATQMLINPGDEVLLAEPTPPAYIEGVRMAGGVPIGLPTCATEQFVLCAERVAAAITPCTRLLLFGSPAVPTGGITSGDDLAAIAQLAVDHDLVVIWDATYRDLVAGSPPQLNIATLRGMRERTVTVGSLSTRYAMGGWRAGFVVGPQAFVHPITLMKQALTICSPAPSQWAALAALEGPQGSVGRLAQEVAARRAAACAVLHLIGIAPAGNGSPFLWFRVDDLGYSGEEFVVLAEKAGMRIQSGNRYGSKFRGWVRLTLNAAVPELTVVLTRLVDVVRQASKYTAMHSLVRKDNVYGRSSTAIS